MDYKETIKLLVLPLAFILLTACQAKNSEPLEESDTDFLASHSVFSAEQTLASFQGGEEITSFDGKNRPLASTDCPPVEPPVECKDHQVLAQDECYDRERPCVIENGEGLQRWLANSYGECEATKCDEGFKPAGGKCEAICAENEIFHNGQCFPPIAECKVNGKKGTKKWGEEGYGDCQTDLECPIKNGVGIQPWIVDEDRHGSCEVVSCQTGYKVHTDRKRCENICRNDQVHDGRKCRDIVRACRIAGGKGKKKWSHRKKKYGRCRVTSCNRGFERVGNSCRRPNNGGDADPLLVDVGSNIAQAESIQLSSQVDGILFDILGKRSTPNPHDKKRISWTSQSRYQWVVLPDPNGQVNGIDQMFGDNTLGPDNQFAKDGFEALAKYDNDSNGKIDPDDPIYYSLGLWADLNGNGQADLGELTSLSDSQVGSINLNYDPNYFEVDQYGNKTTYKSVVNFYDGRKSLIFDLWFKYVEPDQPSQCPTQGGL